jgi:hypothetical protein
LDTDNPKITIVDHSEILPAEIIPTFASTAIERHLTNIPNLTEKFIYANDDIFFNAPLAPEYFFNGDRPQVKMTYYERFRSIESDEDFKEKFSQVATWMQTNLNVWKLLFEQYGHRIFYVSDHTVDSYTKTLFNQTLERYKDAFAAADKERFRNSKCITRSIFGLDMIYSGQADMEILTKPSFWDKHVHNDSHKEWKAYCGSENEKTRRHIMRFHPDMFCVNADIKSNLDDKKAMRAFYQQLFPQPSQFEKSEQ